jgi:penicillin-binding protein 1A
LHFYTSLAEHLSSAVRAHRRLFIGLIVALAVLMWSSAGALAWYLGGVAVGLPDDAAIRGVGLMSRATTVFDAHDTPAFTIFKERRIEVPLSRVSPHLIQAILAVEDQRFFDHGGVDIIRVGGAALSNLRDGWGTQGGSTITQQLARLSFLTRDKTLQRKLKEIIVAARLEGQFSKEQILQMYLNKVYFGDGLYGVEAASLGFFGKHAADLDVSEAALLAGLVKSPSAYAPTVSRERALSRRNSTLQVMRDAGVIDDPTYDSAVRSELRLNDTLRDQEPFGQYFNEEVRKQLVEKFGWERVYEGGLKVYTTLDLNMQKAAEVEIKRTLDDIARRRGRGAVEDEEPLQAALVALDPHTGEVRAMVGGRDFQESRWNRATQAWRQPGSAFKPFVYAAALEQGYTPASVLTELDTPVMTLEGAWVPADHSAGDAMSVRAAMKTSSNRAAVRMLQQIGIPAAVSYAERLGVGSVPSVPSLALGSGEVTLLAMTSAYAAFANGGMLPEPLLIRKVETSEGEVLFMASPHLERAVSEGTAFLMTTMLADVVNGGTAWQARRAGLTLPAAGKTGTTNDYHDAWFVGYTTRLTTGVWIGYDQPRTILRGGYAGDLAVPLWGRFMASATRGERPESFKAPATVTTATICRLSGKLATDDCRDVETLDQEGFAVRQSMVVTEFFIRGTAPTQYCDWHYHAPSLSVPVAAALPAVPREAVPGAALRSRIIEVPTAGAGGGVATSGEREPTATPERPRRGFWSRFFRRGNNERPADPPPSPPAAR